MSRYPSFTLCAFFCSMLAITHAQNVGIGTTSPAALLDVTGDILINGISAGRGSGNLDQNTVFGYQALSSNLLGFQNTVFGYQGLFSNTYGHRNSSYGYSSMANNLTGQYNAAYGAFSLVTNTSGSDNSAFGDEAMFSNTVGIGNAAFGRDALLNNTAGEYNTALGFGAGYNTTTGLKNLFVGAYSNCPLNSGLENATAIGPYAYVTQSNSLVLGSINQVNGANAHTNVGIGTTSPDARLEVTADILINGITIGRGSGSNNSDNTAIGRSALSTNATGDGNTAIGFNTLSSNTFGSENTATGFAALANNFGGSLNSAFGFAALGGSTGTANTGCGSEALLGNTSGEFNSAFGSGAGSSNNTGSFNLFLGCYSNSESGNLTNASAIGSRAVVNTSNSMVLGSIEGVNQAPGTNVGIGTTSPVARLHVEGTLKVKEWYSQDTMGTDGYANMAGIIVQWGYIDYVNNNAVFINFPTDFSQVFSVTATVDAGLNTGSGANVPAKVMEVTNSSFKLAGTAIFINDTVSKVRWMAIGI